MQTVRGACQRVRLFLTVSYRRTDAGDVDISDDLKQEQAGQLLHRLVVRFYLHQ